MTVNNCKEEERKHPKEIQLYVVLVNIIIIYINHEHSKTSRNKNKHSNKQTLRDKKKVSVFTTFASCLHLPFKSFSLSL